VAAPVGLDDLDFVLACEPAVDDDRVASRDRRRERVDDQQDPHGGKIRGKVMARATAGWDWLPDR
jgi:hypothetical protein